MKTISKLYSNNADKTGSFASSENVFEWSITNQLLNLRIRKISISIEALTGKGKRKQLFTYLVMLARRLSGGPNTIFIWAEKYMKNTGSNHSRKKDIKKIKRR